MRRERLERGQASEALGVGLAVAERHPPEHAQPASAAARARASVAPGHQHVGAGRAGGGEPADGRQIRLVDEGLGGVARTAPVAGSRPSCRVRTNDPAAPASRRRAPRGPAAEREQIERRERRPPAPARARPLRIMCVAHLCPSSPQRGISRLASPSWSSTRPTTVSSSASIVVGFE